MRAWILCAVFFSCGGPPQPPVPAVSPLPCAPDLAHLSTNEACVRATGHRGPIDHCKSELLGNGSTALVNIVTDCGGDSCSVKSWMCSPATKGTLVPIDSGGGNVAASPGGDFLIVDDDRAPPDVLRLARIDVATGARSVFADCVSPRLSPGGKWIACRNHAGDVLRVPIGGGKLEVVARSGANADQVPWVPYSYIWPEPVDFPSSDTVTFLTLQIDPATNDVRKLEGRSVWRE